MLEIRFCESCWSDVRGKKKSIVNAVFPLHSESFEQKYCYFIIVSLSVLFYLYKYLCRNVCVRLFIFIYILRICTYTHTSTHTRMYTHIQRGRASRHSKLREQASLLFVFCSSSIFQGPGSSRHAQRFSLPTAQPDPPQIPLLASTPEGHQKSTLSQVAKCWDMARFLEKMKNKSVLSQIALRPHPGIVWFVI